MISLTSLSIRLEISLSYIRFKQPFDSGNRLCYGYAMAAPELEISLRTRGRAAAPMHAEEIRELTSADLTLLASGRGIKPIPLKKLGDRHHLIARLVAQGTKTGEIMAITGMCVSRISILKGDPTFKELVAHYQAVNEGAYADFTDRATLAALTAINNIQEKLEDEENPIPVSMELEIAKAFADRTGYAPVQKSLAVTANVELGSRLAAAQKRLASSFVETTLTLSEDISVAREAPDA